MSKTAIVVGGGIFGRVIQAALNDAGWSARVVDTFNNPLAGSTPAACLMKPSWAAAMNGRDYGAAIALLDRLYGVEKVSLTVRPLGVKQIECHWVRPSKFRLLRADDIFGKVVHVRTNGVVVRRTAGPMEGFNSNFSERYEADLVVVAAGIWTRDLLPQYQDRLAPKMGWAFTTNGQAQEQSIRVYRPYKQVVKFNRDEDEIWINDGITSSITDPADAKLQAQIEQSRVRCSMELTDPDNSGTRQPLRTLLGIRPYYVGPKTPAMCEQVEPGLWVASGGAKNGTLGAAWAAAQIVEAVN